MTQKAFFFMLRLNGCQRIDVPQAHVQKQQAGLVVCILESSYIAATCKTARVLWLPFFF